MIERRLTRLVPGFRDDEDELPPGLPTMLAAWALVLVPMVFNAVTLLPEVLYRVPSLNDNAFQSLLIRGASDAHAAGRNALDFWSPYLELGFAQFAYYQHVPHLAVVVLHRFLLGGVDEVTLFNVVRYVLFVTFPITVFWSMRRMGFSAIASGVGAAAASLFSGGARYGFEYDSYVWRGLGMYTQLWAMHLSFIALATSYRLVRTGSGYLPAVLAIALLALSHLIYAYMMAITLALVVLLAGELRTIGQRVGRLVIAGGAALAVSSYMWLPFILSSKYLGASPYLQEWKYDSFGAPVILGALGSGDLLDHGRLPVLTGLLAIGVVVAVVRRTRLAVLAIVGFLLWLVLYFGRPTLGPLADVLPLSDSLLFHRFIGEMELFVILLIGFAGDGLWRLMRAVGERFGRSRATPWAVPALALVVTMVVLTPAFLERADYYTDNTTWIRRADDGVRADTDLQSILDVIKAQPYGGRTYAGLRTNFGDQMTVGVDLRVRDLLTFHDIPAVSPPYQSLSLNADMIWWFEDGDPSDFDVMDVRYAIVPATFTVPEFYTELARTPRYALHRVQTSGTAAYVEIASRRSVTSQRELFDQNLAWYRGQDPAARRFIRWDYLEPLGPVSLRAGCPTGATETELAGFDTLVAVVECPTDSALALKMTYHPNWRVRVDGVEVPTYMVSPSYIGIDLPAGRHTVEAAYVATPSKVPLLAFGLVVLGLVAAFRRRLDAIPARFAPAPVAASARVDGTPAARPRIQLSVPTRVRRGISGRSSMAAMHDGAGAVGEPPWPVERPRLSAHAKADAPPAARFSLDEWALPILLAVGLLLPVAIAVVSGTLEIPRNDDWSYRRIALSVFETGRLEGDYAVRTFTFGQVLLTLPLLWLSGGLPWAFVLAGLAFQTLAVLAGYFAFRRILRPAHAALAIGSVLIFPGYLPFAVSYMSDVPALAASWGCIGLGMVALDQGRVRLPWLVAALGVGVLAFTIREVTVAAPIAVAMTAILARPRRLRIWYAGIATILLIAFLYIWRQSIPGQHGEIPNSSIGAYRLLLAASTISLVLLPAAIIGAGRWGRRLEPIGLLVGAVVGLAVIAPRLIQVVTTGRIPQVFLDVNLTQYGAPAQMYLTGGRPVLFPEPVWSILGVIGLIATVVVAAIAGGIAGAYARRALRDPRGIRRALATPPGLVAIFAGGTSLGLLMFGLNQWIYDRYFWVLIPPFVALLLYRPSAFDEEPSGSTPHARRSGGAVAVLSPLRGIAGVAIAILVAMSLVVHLNSAAFDAARWRAAEALVATGVSPDTVDAGYEWVGYHATTRAQFADATFRFNWWQSLWPGFRMCGLVASEPQSFAGARLVAADAKAYRLLLFFGPDVPLYLYRVVSTSCPPVTS